MPGGQEDMGRRWPPTEPTRGSQKEEAEGGHCSWWQGRKATLWAAGLPTAACKLLGVVLEVANLCLQSR